MNRLAPYKTCSCGTSWNTRCDLVADKHLKLNGYQACFEEPAQGLFVLTHQQDGCFSTIGVTAGDFRDFYSGPDHTVLKAGEDGCPRLCLLHDRFETCDQHCSMHWVRVVLQYFRNHEIPEHVRFSADVPV